MKIRLLYLSVFVSVAVTAQDVSVQWNNMIGGSSSDSPRSVEPTSDGGCIIAGRSFSSISGDKTENSLGEQDFWIVKLDASGNVEWENTIGGAFIDDANAVRQMEDGTYIIAGTSSSLASEDKSENTTSARDAWVMKLNAQGVIIWEDTLVADQFDQSPSLVVTNDQGVLVGVASSSGIGGDKTVPTNGESDYWIIKYSGDGNIEWQRSIGGSGSDFMDAIDKTSDGGYILGGASSSPVSGDKTQPSQGANDYWIVKVDSEGNVLWDKTYGGNNNDRLTSVYETLDGGFILGGSSDSDASGDKSEENLGGDDYWVVRTDSAGSIIWENTIGGSQDEANGFTIPLLTGDFLVTGWSNSDISGDKTENSNGEFDYWIVQLNDSGETIQDSSIGGEGNELLFRGELSSYPENLFLVGQSSSEISGDVTDQHNGGGDYWALKLEGILGLRDLVLNKENMYPIPAQNKIFYTGTAISIEELRVIGVNGKVYKSLENPNFNNGIDISNLSTGIYFVQLRIAGQVSSYKIIKE